MIKNIIDSLYTAAYLNAVTKPLKHNLLLFDLQEYNESTISDLIKNIFHYNPSMTFAAAVSNTPDKSTVEALKRLNIKTVKRNEKKYYKLYSQAEYIYADMYPPHVFTKRSGQVYVVDSTILCNEQYSGFASFSAVQKVLLAADIIICGTHEAKKNMCEFYYLNRIYHGYFIIEEKSKEEFSRQISFALLNKDRIKQEPVKKTILIFCSDLRRNGMTTSLLNLLSLMNLNNMNIIVTYKEEIFINNPERLSSLPDKIILMPVHGDMVKKKPFEILLHSLYFRFHIDLPFIYKRIAAIYHRAYEHFFGNINIKAVIHFTGYSPEFAMLFMKSSAKRIIFVHNDMHKEYAEKKNFHMPTLLHAYENYDITACVSSAVKESLKKLKLASVNARILENAHDHEGILHSSNEPLSMDTETIITIPLEKVMEVLYSDVKKFITIGRFSKEKGHIKLMKAFSEFNERYKDTVLFIIGGYGPFYQDTIDFKNSLPCRDNIIIIKSIMNPAAILKHCNLFILPSDREPLGLVLLEATSLNLPIIATNIRGSGDFMKRYGGYLVENNVKSLREGMQAYIEGKVKPLSIDFTHYNAQIIEDFTKMLL